LQALLFLGDFTDRTASLKRIAARGLGQSSQGAARFGSACFVIEKWVSPAEEEPLLMKDP
jgi:hypothetical protein